MNSTFFVVTKYYRLSLYLIQAFACITFCILALFVLVYFINRIFKLYREMRSVTPEKLYFYKKYNFRNHLKNLKIKVMINNFIIVILLIELVNNIVSFFIFLILCLRHFYNNAFEGFHWYLHQIGFISYFCYLPILCLLMNVLWLVYLHSECKYSIKRWTAYILLRLIAIYIVCRWQYWEYATHDKAVYQHTYSSIYWITRVTFEIIDLFTYVKYSKRFYLHLKSRVLEAKLFYDKRQYLQNSYICHHFKIATILVVIAFLLHTFGDINYIIMILTYYLSTDSNYQVFTKTEWSYIIQVQIVPLNTFHLLYRILLNLNYFYLFSIFIFMKWKQRSQFNKVNDKIRPLVKRYHDTINENYLSREVI